MPSAGRSCTTVACSGFRAVSRMRKKPVALSRVSASSLAGIEVV
jgi:hypothetical protein